MSDKQERAMLAIWWTTAIERELMGAMPLPWARAATHHYLFDAYQRVHAGQRPGRNDRVFISQGFGEYAWQLHCEAVDHEGILLSRDIVVAERTGILMFAKDQREVAKLLGYVTDVAYRRVSRPYDPPHEILHTSLLADGLVRCSATEQVAADAFARENHELRREQMQRAELHANPTRFVLAGPEMKPDEGHVVDLGCARPTHAGPEVTCPLCHPDQPSRQG
jgi:hypothetical protein